MGTVGFIGLGAMGSRMARNLIKTGRKLILYDLEPERIEAVVKGNPYSEQSGVEAISANSIYEVASESSTIITMLPNSKDVFNCYKRILPHFRQEKILCIDSSTIDPFTTKEIYQFLTQKDNNNVEFVDAPVSGGVTGAQSGTLTFMVGGTIEEFIKVKPILSSMGRNIVHCGPVGSGQVAKICNNLLAGISMIGTSEAFILGEKLGIHKDTLFKVLKTKETKSWTTDTYCPVDGLIEGIPSSRGYKDGFACGLMAKDLEFVSSIEDHLFSGSMVDKSAYIPVETVNPSSSKNRSAELEIDIDDNDYFGKKSTMTSTNTIPEATASTSSSAAIQTPQPSPRKHVYQKSKTYQKTYARGRK